MATPIIVDANTWSRVFDSANLEHGDFKPVLDCIGKRKATLVYGGKTYMKELKESPKYLQLHAQYRKARMAEFLDAEEVDTQEIEVRGKEDNPDFDDPHIIAIQIVSKAPVICSKDERAEKFFKKAQLYPKGHKSPKIYKRKEHVSLLAQFYR